MTMKDWRFGTLAVHAGRNQDEDAPRGPSGGLPPGRGRPVAPGIQPASSFAYDSLEALHQAFGDPARSYVYARHGSPTTDELARAVAALEGAEGAVAFSSGMAAIHAALLAAGLT